MKLYRGSAIGLIRAEKANARNYFSRREDIQRTYGVGGSTFRSYVGFKNPPSIIFRAWAKSTGFSTRILKRMDSIEAYEDFQKIHSTLVRSLQRHWVPEQRKELSQARLYKLIDLFVKAVSRSDTNFSHVNRNLVQYGHIPLDRFSLLAVKKCFSGIIVSRSPSMGDLEDNQTYKFIQSQIKELMKACKLPNLYFDYYAWNAKH